MRSALASLAGACMLALAVAGCGGAGTAPVVTIVVNRASATVPQASSGSSTRTAAAARDGAAPGVHPVVTRTLPAAVQPTPPPVTGRLASVSVWVPYWGLSTSVATTIAHAGTVRIAHPFWYEISGDATVSDESGGAGPGVISQLHAAGLEVIPTVTETAKMGQFAKTLASPSKRRALLAALVRIAEQPGVNGIDLDFENMAFGDGSAATATRVATLYPQLVAALCERLHGSGRSCEVTVIAKNDPGLEDRSGLDTFVYDYAALAQVADRIQVMAYDDHVPSGRPGAIAPLPWVQSVVAYSLTQMPASKLVLGVPAYGYDWTKAGHATSLTATAAEALATEMRARIRWDAAAQEPYFTYATGRHKHRIHHTVWFEDAAADYDRAVLAANDRLAGIAIWAAGDEDPAVWAQLARLR